jgi:hypothetical protein
VRIGRCSSVLTAVRSRFLSAGRSSLPLLMPINTFHDIRASTWTRPDFKHAVRLTRLIRRDSCGGKHRHAPARWRLAAIEACHRFRLDEGQTLNQIFRSIICSISGLDRFVVVGARTGSVTNALARRRSVGGTTATFQSLCTSRFIRIFRQSYADALITRSQQYVCNRLNGAILIESSWTRKLKKPYDCRTKKRNPRGDLAPERIRNAFHRIIWQVHGNPSSLPAASRGSSQLRRPSLTLPLVRLPGCSCAIWPSSSP